MHSGTPLLNGSGMDVIGSKQALEAQRNYIKKKWPTCPELLFPCCTVLSLPACTHSLLGSSYDQFTGKGKTWDWLPDGTALDALPQPKVDSCNTAAPCWDIPKEHG